MKQESSVEQDQKTAMSLCVLFFIELIVIVYGLSTIKDGESQAFVVGGHLVEFLLVVLGSVVLSALIILVGLLAKLALRRP